MTLAAFQHYERGGASEDFSPAAIGIRSVNLSPFASLSQDKPGPHKTQSDLSRGAEVKIGQAIRTAFADQQKAINDNGLADVQNAQLGNVISPADLILPGGGMVMTAIGAAGYAMADRRSTTHPVIYAESSPTEDFRRVQWNTPGYHAASLPGDRDSTALTREEAAAILRPLEQDKRMQLLYFRQRNTREARTNLYIREDKGLLLNAETVAAALEQDQTTWMYRDGPVPAYL